MKKTSSRFIRVFKKLGVLLIIKFINKFWIYNKVMPNIIWTCTILSRNGSRTVSGCYIAYFGPIPETVIKQAAYMCVGSTRLILFLVWLSFA